MRYFLLVICLLLLPICEGCGKKSNRLHVHGTITWKGQPIPRGIISFGPDSSKGGKGPDGFALIVDGEYDSNGHASKGPVAGWHFVKISTGDGKNRTALRPYGNMLTKTYETTIEIPANGGELNFKIPDDIPLAAPPSKEPD